MRPRQVPEIDLLAWLSRPSHERGIRFVDDAGESRFVTYDELAVSTLSTAAEIADLAGERLGPIAVVLSTGPQFVTTFFGAIHAGFAACPLTPPRLLQGRKEYINHVAPILRSAEPALIVTEPQFSDVVTSAAEAAGLGNRVRVLTGEWSPTRTRREGDLALLQYTSGSTDAPRGVQVTRDSLESNIGMMIDWLNLGEADGIASWLPLYHDMGLIGTLLTPIVCGLHAHVISPYHFIRDPAEWLRCFSPGMATATASPGFGFGYASSRINSESAASLDLSSMRVLIAGAERLDPRTMRAFAEIMSGRGFRPQALTPAYGLAEATLAVTGVPVDEIPSAVEVDWSSLRPQQRVRILSERRVTDAEAARAGTWVADCGEPLAGVDIRVVGENTEEVGELEVGEIVVSARSVADGYKHERPCNGTFFRNGAVHTGDAGFIRNGRLFVLGRIADSISVRGRNLYAEDLEASICSDGSLSRGRVVVVMGYGAQRPIIAAVIEGPTGEWVQRAARLLARHGRDQADLAILRVPRGTIARTSSGKPKRRQMLNELLENRLSAAVEWATGDTDWAYSI